MLRFSGQFSTAHRYSAQFSNTYKVRPICIVYSKQPFVLLAKAWFIYTVRSTQFAYSSPTVHLHSSLAQFVHAQSEYRLNLWIVLFSFALAGAKTPLVQMYAYKSTYIPAHQKTQFFDSLNRKQFKNTEMLANSCLIHCPPYVSVVSGILTIHFNTC